MCALAAPVMQPAIAYPEGAPWGSANPAADEDCASCHFGADPVHASPALRVVGLPERLESGQSYELTVVFELTEGLGSGFQMIAWAEEQEPGEFEALQDNLESVGAAIRSTAPFADGTPAAWRLRWHTPVALPAEVHIHLAASAANLDQSPLGDTIHYRSYRLETRTD